MEIRKIMYGLTNFEIWRSHQEKVRLDHLPFLLLISHLELTLDLLSVVCKHAIELLDSALIDDVELIAKSTEEVFVVTDHDQTSLKVVQGNDQCIDGIEIKMIGWLIQHENMWLFPCDHSERNSTLLTT